MNTSDKGIVALMMHEGIVPGPYLDSVGVWTYGIGHTSAAGAPDPATMKRGMPADMDAELARVFAVFRADLPKYEAAVRRVLPSVKQHEFDAAVSFHYNTGAIGRASWVKKLAAGDVAGAASGIMDWHKPPEIIKRREDERDLLLLGKYPTGAITVWNVSETGEVIWKPVRSIPADVALAWLRPEPVAPPVKPDIVTNHPDIVTKPGFLATLIEAIKALFGGKK